MPPLLESCSAGGAQRRLLLTWVWVGRDDSRVWDGEPGDFGPTAGRVHVSVRIDLLRHDALLEDLLEEGAHCLRYGRPHRLCPQSHRGQPEAAEYCTGPTLGHRRRRRFKSNENRRSRKHSSRSTVSDML